MLSKVSQPENKLNPSLERIAITYGDAGENHAGMQMVGKLGGEGSGFTTNDLLKIKTSLEKGDTPFKCDYYNLSNPEAVEIRKRGGKWVKMKKTKEAGVLVVRNFLDSEKVEELYREVTSVEWDTKYYDTRRKKVLNKLARENLVFLKGISQEPDYENKKGRIVDWTKLENFKELSETLFGIINSNTDKKGNNMIAEGNRYLKKKGGKKVKNGIGWHGDAERRKVICVSIGGVDYSMKWQWFYKHKPINMTPFEVTLNSGDVYIMSEEAVGQKWKCSSIYTLRHCAGDESFTKYKKAWITSLNGKIKDVSDKKPNSNELEKIKNEVLESMATGSGNKKIIKKVKRKKGKKKLKLTEEKIDLDNMVIKPQLKKEKYIPSDEDVDSFISDLIAEKNAKLDLIKKLQGEISKIEEQLCEANC